MAVSPERIAGEVLSIGRVRRAVPQAFRIVAVQSGEGRMGGHSLPKSLGACSIEHAGTRPDAPTIKHPDELGMLDDRRAHNFWGSVLVEDRVVRCLFEAVAA